jgi:tetratricopeptide (TPR) repeat protein
MLHLRHLGLLLVLAAGCGAGRAPAPAAAPTAAHVLPFIEDDWPRALEEARRQKRPLFVDAWATWCHSCLSMRAYVLTDRALQPLADRFVWLAVDTDKPQNAAFVRRFANESWPTLWVIDPATEKPRLKWAGTATAAELTLLLGSLDASNAPNPATVDFARGNHALAQGDKEEARKAFSAALDAAGPAHPHYGRIAEALVTLLSDADQAACVEVALRTAPALPAGTSRATVIAAGLECAREAKRAPAVATLKQAAERAVADPDARMVADDRSALFMELVEAAREAGDTGAVKGVAARWAAFLEQEAARAATPRARAVFDAHRLAAYLALGEPARALPILEQSAKDFPDDFNPHAQLARAFFKAGQLDRAKAAVDRAVAKVYGPRALSVLTLAADIAKARRDLAGERAALQQALARTADAPLSPAQRQMRAGLEKRLQALPAQ